MFAQERTVKAKHCQYTSGVPAPIFWLGTYLWDLCNYFVPCIAILIMFAAFDIEAYITGETFGSAVYTLLTNAFFPEHTW